MKKLMIVALAVASCTAFAEEEQAIKKGVYTLSFTQKGLEPAAKKFTEKSKSSDKFYGATAEAATANAVAVAESKQSEIIEKLEKDEIWIDPESFVITTKAVKESKSAADKEKGAYVCSGWTMTYNAQAVSTKGVKSSKVVSHAISGIYVTGYGDIDGAYTWDPKVKTGYVNTYVNTKGKEVKLATAMKETDFATEARVTEDGKASMVLEWESLRAVGTGTSAIKDDKGNYAYVKSIAGNAVDPDPGFETYGTWKFAPDNTLTKLAETTPGITIEQILAKKKVELDQ